MGSIKAFIEGILHGGKFTVPDHKVLVKEKAGGGRL